MSIAIITGASSGLGYEYALALQKLHPEIDEYWLIARRADRLEALSKRLPSKNVRTLALDLTRRENIEAVRELLGSHQARVCYLINNAGYGRLGDFIDMPAQDTGGMVELNCAALTEMTSVVLPFIERGGSVLNVCSIAAFVPNPRMAVYCSTKAYVLSLSNALRFELKGRGVNVLAACPGPMDTEFLGIAGIPGHSPQFDRLPRVNPVKVAEKSLRAADKGRAVYTNHPFYKLYRVLGKLLPHSFMMHLSKC